VDQAIIGLMDPAHGPFVHQAWWWRSRHSIREKEKQFEPIPDGFRMSAHAPSANSAPYKILKFLTGEPATTTIDFVLPNQRFEQIRAGKYWLSSRTTVTPIRPDLCRLDFCAAWNILPWFPIVSFIVNVFGPRFIRQDTEVIEKQTMGLRYEDRMMLIDDADRQARWYFDLYIAQAVDFLIVVAQFDHRAIYVRRVRSFVGVEQANLRRYRINRFALLGQLDFEIFFEIGQRQNPNRGIHHGRIGISRCLIDLHANDEWQILLGEILNGLLRIGILRRLTEPHDLTVGRVN
jgi:hypothetical protein